MNEEILKAIPHRPPFLFVDEIIERTENSILAKRTVRPDEPHFEGHYPGNPIMPGVLAMEALFQTGALLMAGHAEKRGGGVPLLARVNKAKFKRMVVPGDTMTMEVELKEIVEPAAFMKGKVRVGNEVAVVVEFAVALGSEE